MVYKRSYVGAESGRLYNWQTGSDKSADGEIKSALPILRRRSRELIQNEPLAKRYLSLLNTQVIGRQGIKLQMKARNDDSTLDLPANNMVEMMWSQWSRKSNPMYSGCDVSGKFTFLDIQRQVLDAVVRDGEALIYVHEGRSNPHGIQLELMTADRLDVDKNEVLQNGNIIRMGIEMEQRIRRPVAYWINVKENPLYESFAFSPAVGGTYERIPAERIIHVFHSDRMEQSRGVPWMASAMPHIKLLQTYLENEVVASSLASAKIATVSNNTGDEYVGTGVEDSYTPLSSMEAGSIEQLPSGWEMNPLEFSHPTSQFPAMVETVIQHIASGLSVPYSDLSSDMTGASYSSLRQEQLQAREYYRTVQTWFIDQFIDPVFQRWLSSALTTPDSNGRAVLPLPVEKFDKWSDGASWYPRGFEGVDPLKDANAKQVGLRNGFVSLQDVASDRGTDLESLFAQHQQAKALAEQYGIDLAFEPYGTPHQSVAPDSDPLSAVSTVSVTNQEE
nr:phage portal protein [uncultured Mediterranean phage uvMED]